MTQTLWGVVNTLIRISAILLIKAVFSIKVVGRISWLLLVLSILYGLTVLLEVFLICRPMAVDWNASVDGTCGNQVLSYLVLEALGLLLDFSIVVLPIPFIWRIQIPRAKKLNMSIIFSIGVL